jgi:hypothetical protein
METLSDAPHAGPRRPDTVAVRAHREVVARHDVREVQKRRRVHVNDIARVAAQRPDDSGVPDEVRRCGATSEATSRTCQPAASAVSATNAATRPMPVEPPIRSCTSTTRGMRGKHMARRDMHAVIMTVAR